MSGSSQVIKLYVGFTPGTVQHFYETAPPLLLRGLLAFFLVLITTPTAVGTLLNMRSG